MQASQGMIYIFTGEGKGKTSAALGTAIRAASAGLKVAIIQWYKSKAWGISEHEINHPNIAIFPMGAGFFFKDKGADPKPHRQAAQAALQKAETIMKSVDVLILDEINNAIHDELITVDEIKTVLQQRNSTHCILTGRYADPKLVDLADLVTEMKPIKHPYDQGKQAIKGLDY
jgi:cob(I)alamin adenosyltransferase